MRCPYPTLERRWRGFQSWRPGWRVWWEGVLVTRFKKGQRKARLGSSISLTSWSPGHPGKYLLPSPLLLAEEDWARIFLWRDGSLILKGPHLHDNYRLKMPLSARACVHVNHTSSRAASAHRLPSSQRAGCFISAVQRGEPCLSVWRS